MRKFDVIVMTPVQRDILAHQEVARQPMGRCLVVQLQQVEGPLMDSFGPFGDKLIEVCYNSIYVE